MTLQNHPGERDFPVRMRWRYARSATAGGMRTDRRARMRFLAWLVSFAVLLVVSLATLRLWSPAFGSSGDDTALGVALAIVVAVFGGLLIATVADARLPLAEQRRYLRLAGVAPTTERQQQLLALDAQSDFEMGGWNSSLEYGPAWVRLPHAVRERQRRRSAPLFGSFPLHEQRPVRDAIDNDYRVASGRDLELYVADALADRGMSAGFLAVLQGEDADRMVSRVASLTGLDEWAVRELAEPRGDRPPLLLWAADVQRLVALVRMGFVAGHVGETDAWVLLERLGAVAFALFPDADAYWSNVRVGIAFGADRMDAITAFDDAYEDLQRSAWPAAWIDWPEGDLRTLPRGVAHPSSQAMTPEGDGRF